MTQSYSLFFYGTLMSPAVLHRVIYGLSTSPPSSTLKIRSALLHDHERHRVLHVDYPGVIPRQGSSVLGTLVQNLTPSDVARLDAFEGDEYERRGVTVHVEGEEVKAATYIWIAGEDRLEKGEWNFEEFCKEKLSRWTGESQEFEESDKVATGGRSAWNGETVRSAV